MIKGIPSSLLSTLQQLTHVAPLRTGNKASGYLFPSLGPFPQSSHRFASRTPPFCPHAPHPLRIRKRMR